MPKPKITGMTPVLGIGSYEETVAFYVEWLGFTLDWEWREEPGQPVIMAISRDDVSMMLNEHADKPGPSWLTFNVTGLEGLAEEWNGRRPDSVAVIIEQPYDIPTIAVEDPFGNHLDFTQPLSAEEEEARKDRAAQMRDYIRERLAAGEPCPSPEQLVEAIGRPVGLAIQVLGEFPEHGPSTEES